MENDDDVVRPISLEDENRRLKGRINWIHDQMQSLHMTTAIALGISIVASVTSLCYKHYELLFFLSIISLSLFLVHNQIKEVMNKTN